MFYNRFIVALSALILAAALRAGDVPPAATPGADEELTPEQREAKFLPRLRQLTFVGSKNGEAYFSFDGSEVIFQGVREPENPFYQIYRLGLSKGDATRVSPGTGETTCSFFHPKRPRLLFASTHLDPASAKKQQEEIARAESAPARRYVWDFDENFDIFESDLNGGNLTRLTDASGYDAEGSYSPDGTKIVFCSRRDNDEEIYIMDADGKNQTRLTNEKGYDGGPFFSPDGKQIVWRHFTDEAQKSAEVWLMDSDGKNKRQVTKLGALAWAPYFHPSMEWLVFASNHEDPAFEVYAIRPDGSELTRLTWSQGFDGLPVISPDGQSLMWTSNRAQSRSQLWIADLRLPLKRNPELRAPRELSASDNNAIKSWWNASQNLHGGGAAGLTHTVAARFKRAELLPTNPGPKDEETSFIAGPMVVGWVPPTGESSRVVVLAGALKPDDVSCGSTAALLEAAYSGRAEQKNGMNVAGLYIVAANEDALGQIALGMPDLVKYAQKTTGRAVKPAAFVSLAGLGGMRSRRVVIRGAGTSPGWPQLVERLAARHPQVRFILEDDPAGAPPVNNLPQGVEVRTMAEAGIPSISFGEISDKAALELDADIVADDAATTGYVLAAAMDCVRMIVTDAVPLPYTKYDAAAAQAAASASRRPYLGTIPEYNASGVKGVKLSGVREGSPAQVAGLAAGDVIVALNEQAIASVEDYLKALEALSPGLKTKVTVQRGEKKETFDITVGSR